MLQQIFITSVRVGNICQWIYLSCHFGISKISPCAQKHSGGLITLSDFLLCLVPVSSRAGQQQQSSQNSLIVWLLIVSTTLHPPVSSLRQRWSQLMREHPSLHIRQTSNQPFFIAKLCHSIFQGRLLYIHPVVGCRLSSSTSPLNLPP